jgi:hypothetical protein
VVQILPIDEVKQALAEKLRDALAEYLDEDMFSTKIPSPELNNLRAALVWKYWTTGDKNFRVVDPSECFVFRQEDGESHSYLKFVDSFVCLKSRRCYSYGQYGIRMKFPPSTDTSWNTLYFGCELTSRTWGGGGMFIWTPDRVGNGQATLTASSLNRAATIDRLITLPYAPDAEYQLYTVKLNKASVEFWQTQWKPTHLSKLLGVIQFAEESDTYTIATSPYLLAQCKGAPPTHQPLLLEYIAASDDKAGTVSNISVDSIWAGDGDPAPPRSWMPYTGGVAWEGTVISAGTLTSDRIPVAGYDKKTILFLANQAGILYVDVDYGDNGDDEYDSTPTSANTLEPYVLTADPLWIRLRFTPTAYPCTVTRARVITA